MTQISQWGTLGLADTGQQFAYTTFEVTAEDRGEFASVTNTQNMFHWSVIS